MCDQKMVSACESEAIHRNIMDDSRIGTEAFFY